MGRFHDTRFVEGKVTDGNLEVNYSKNGNSMTITTNDGRKMCIAIDASTKIGKDSRNNVVRYVTHDVFMDYSIRDGSSLVLSNSLALPEGYDGFEGVQRHDLKDGLRTKFVDKDGKEEATFNLDLTKVCLIKNNRVYEFTKDGILYGNKLISLDGDKLLAISGFDTPSLETAKSYNSEEEKAKVRKVIEEGNFHPFTVNALEGTIRELDKQKRYASGIIDFYENDLGDIRKVIAIRSKIMDSLEKGFIGEKELSLVDKDFSKKTRGRILEKRP